MTVMVKKKILTPFWIIFTSSIIYQNPNISTKKAFGIMINYWSKISISETPTKKIALLYSNLVQSILFKIRIIEKLEK